MSENGLEVKLRLGTKHDPLFEVRKHLAEAEELQSKLELAGFRGTAGGVAGAAASRADLASKDYVGRIERLTAKANAAAAKLDSPSYGNFVGESQRGCHVAFLDAHWIVE